MLSRQAWRSACSCADPPVDKWVGSSRLQRRSSLDPHHSSPPPRGEWLSELNRLEMRRLLTGADTTFQPHSICRQNAACWAATLSCQCP